MDEHKRELDHKFIYVRFCYWLANLDNKEYVESLLEEIIIGLKNNDNQYFSKCILKLNSIIEKIDLKLKPRVDLDIIVYNISKNSTKYNPSFGIPFGHLNELFDLEKSEIYPSGLPDHARVGFINHSSTHMVEELILLEDSFIFFSEALTYFDMYEKMMEEMVQSISDNDKKRFYELMTSIKKNVILKCKRGVTSFYSFLESFVNSVGYDFAQNKSNALDEKQIAILEGYKDSKRRNYLSLNDKIMKFSRIISGALHPPIDLNSKNAPDYSKFFFTTLTEIRNSLMHYSPNKVPIAYKFDKWVNILVSTAQATLELSKDFWKASFPNRKYPEYLLDLDIEFLYNSSVKELFEMQDFICLNIDTYKERKEYEP